MAVGASGRHGNHVVWRVEGEIEHVLAYALIQRQVGTEWIAPGQISPQSTAICTFAKVSDWKSKRQQFIHYYKFFVPHCFF